MKKTAHQPNSSVRDRLIEAALELFQAQGFHQTGLNQILRVSGAPKGSLYHYFPGGKDELACAAIDRATADVINQLSQRAVGVSDYNGLVTLFFEYFIESMQSSGFKKGCPIATITLEQAESNERIRSACARAYDAWLLVLSQVLSALGMTNPASVANQLLSSVEGALILTRARKSVSPLQDMKEILLRKSL